MYMAFMIFCAQTKNVFSESSRQSSISSSYNSTDSAIAECCKHDIMREYQPAYGQFYFAKDNNFIISNKNYSSLDERTPLASASAAAAQANIQLNLPHSQQLLENSVCSKQVDRLSDSVSLNLGIAIKNSTCLVKADQVDDVNYQHDSQSHYYNDKNEQQQQQQRQHQNRNHNFDPSEQHEDNWVSSKWILVPMLPLTLSMKCLTPCKFKNTCWTIWTFLVSIVLIGGLTYISVWMVHLFGQSVGIPETVAGMTILSWGTGIPELIASIVLIKKTAQADMAICNTIGSNVIDVSFCLSLPW